MELQVVDKDDEAGEDRARKSGVPSPLEDSVQAALCRHRPLLASATARVSVPSITTVKVRAKHALVLETMTESGLHIPKNFPGSDWKS